MANFSLSWTPNITGNVTAQRAYYRQKSIGGAFLTTGFSPANDLGTGVATTTVSGLTDNVIYEFQVANICTTGGPTFNNNGVQEGIKFACVTPTETHTDTTITAQVAGLPADISKVMFRLYNSTGATLLQGPIDIATSAGAASNTFTGLTASTDYIVKVELKAVVNGVEITSSLLTCQVAVTTNAPATCPAPLNLSVTTV